MDISSQAGLRKRTKTAVRESFYVLKRASTRAIWLCAALLSAYWVVSFLVIAQVIYLTIWLGSAGMFSPFMPSTGYLLCGLIGIGAAALHWLWATRSVLDRTFRIFSLQKLDPQAPYHTLFRNIVEEISIATGNRVPIQCAVIPCGSLNGLSLRDPRKRSVVAVTEGMLARMKRGELQAVVAQLTGQILTEDALVSTVAFSLFGSLRKAIAARDQSVPAGCAGTRENAALGRADNFFSTCLRVISGLGLLLNTALSRQRVFRSDALAVELTRDPLGLAMALRRLERAWRGSGTFAPGTEAVLFVPPGRGAHDVAQGFFRSLIGTHPPLRERLKRALRMAGKTAAAVDTLLKKGAAPRAVPYEGPPQKEPLWKVFHGGVWQGPFLLRELLCLPYLGAKALVVRLGTGQIMHAEEDPLLHAELFQKATAEGRCPHCRVALVKTRYEGVPTYTCPACSGHLVPQDGVQRILIRPLLSLSEELKEKAI